MNFTTLSISIMVLLFCLSFNIVNAFNYDLANDPSNINHISPLQVRTPGKNYSDTGIPTDPENFNTSMILDKKDAELQQYSGYYGFSGISMSGIIYDTFLKASFDLGSFIRTLIGVSDTNSTVYKLTEFIQWGIILNHMFVLMQLVFRPMGYEL